MIVRPRPGALQLFFIVRGSILPQIALKIAFISLLACAVVACYENGLLNSLKGLSAPPFSLLGVALSVFLGFRNSTCYDRWWEARKQWGELIIQTRSLARESQALLVGEQNAALRERLLKRSIAFAYALVAQLRHEDTLAAIRERVSAEELARLQTRRNVPDSLLHWMHIWLPAYKRGA